MTRASPGVLRAAAILNFMADHPARSFTLTDLVRALKLSRATCHALLTGLVDVGYLYRASDKNYVLGPALALIGRLAEKHTSPLEIARPQMQALADEFGFICSAYFRENDEIVVREKTASAVHGGWSSPVGTRLKIRLPFGATYFAWSPSAELDTWMNRYGAPQSEAHRTEMMNAIEFARSRGFACVAHLIDPTLPADDFPEGMATLRNAPLEMIESDANYRVIGMHAPVYDPRGHFSFVMGLNGIRGVQTGVDIERIGQRLKEVSDGVTEQIRLAGER